MQTIIHLIQKLIDSFYFIFKSFMPLKTYRYAACGGGNLALDMILYFVFYNYVYQQTDVDLGFMVMSPHIAALFTVYPITLLSGFLLNKYITFSDSNLKSRTQFVRYTMVSVGSIILSYGLMKLFVDGFGLWATPSKFLTIVITVIYSYVLQTKFSFKVNEA